MVLSKFFKQVFITEGQQEFQKTVALVGGSFKPPHAGHFYMVEQYAKMADEVIVLISDPKNPKSIRKTKNGTVISAQMAKDIFDLYINRYGLQGKVKTIISPEPSPITAMFKYIDENLNDVNVIMGVSKKGGDEARFKSAEKYYAENEHIHLIDPMKTAVEPYVDKNGNGISATDLRNNIDNPQFLKSMLPEKLSDSDVQKVLDILEVKPTLEAEEESKKNLDKCDETEDIALDITEDMLAQAKLYAYNVGLQAKDDRGKAIPVVPKKFPNKAIDIVFPAQQLLVEVFLDTDSKKWDSCIKCADRELKLSPDQMGQFFMSKFYGKLMAKLQREWPLTDELYGSLYSGVANREMMVGQQLPLAEDGEEDKKKELANKDVDGDNKRDYTASGRKIVKFSDMKVSSDSARFFCWPNKKKLFNWSTWKSWKKIKPLCRMRFKHGQYEYGLSLSPIKENIKNRGFRAYNLTLEPHLQWLTHEETEQVMKLSIVHKFLRHCVTQIEEAVQMDPDEIYSKINNPEMITPEEIAITQSIIRKTLSEIIKKEKVDSFKWS